MLSYGSLGVGSGATHLSLEKATRPCPCGFLGHPSRECRCTPHEVGRYSARISGPLLDRIDIQLDVPTLPFSELAEKGSGESSAAILARVVAARARQRERLAGEKAKSNAELSPRSIRKHCAVDADGKRLLTAAGDRMGLSGRAHDRILKVARTIADLAGAERIGTPHLAEAIRYRDRPVAVA